MLRLKSSLFVLFVGLAAALGAQQHKTLFPGTYGDELSRMLRKAFKPGRVLSYSQARDLMYAEIDNYGDSVACVYSGHVLYVAREEDPSQYLYRNGDPDGINCEHLWPQSKGAGEGNARSDLHHLFPTRTAVNESRQNYPLGEVADERAEAWFYHSFSRNSVPASFAIDEYSEVRQGQFEPREDFKGNAARAMFYFFTMYQKEALQADPRFFIVQREHLCRWHIEDPVDEQEYLRSMHIARYQENKPNPFVIDPSLPQRIYCSGRE